MNLLLHVGNVIMIIIIIGICIVGSLFLIAEHFLGGADD